MNTSTNLFSFQAQHFPDSCKRSVPRLYIYAEVGDFRYFGESCQQWRNGLYVLDWSKLACLIREVQEVFTWVVHVCMWLCANQEIVENEPKKEGLNTVPPLAMLNANISGNHGYTVESKRRLDRSLTLISEQYGVTAFLFPLWASESYFERNAEGAMDWHSSHMYCV